MAPEGSGGSTRWRALVLVVRLPEYMIDDRPDYSLGKRVDRVITDHFDFNRIVIRAISSSDHPRYSLDALAGLVTEMGTDKYEPDRKGVSHEEFEPYRPDFQAAPFEIGKEDDSFFGGIMRNFYERAPLDRRHPLRIDLLLIYDRDLLLPAEKLDPEKPGTDPRLERYLFRFRNPDRKRDALLCVVKIL